jgi:hypothetical protein
MWWLSRYSTLSFQVTWWLSRYSSFRGGWHTTVWTDSLGTTLTPVPSTLGAVSLEINEPAARIEPLSAPNRKKKIHLFPLPALFCEVQQNRIYSGTGYCFERVWMKQIHELRSSVRSWLNLHASYTKTRHFGARNVMKQLPLNTGLRNVRGMKRARECWATNKHLGSKAWREETARKT